MEKTKIKSKWKQERRKLQDEGSVAKLPWEIAKEYEQGQNIDEDQEQQDDGERDVGQNPEDVEDDAGEDNSDNSDRNLPLEGDNSPSTKPLKTRKARQSSPAGRTNHDRSNQRSKRPLHGKEADSDSEEQSQPSLRDLKREAYSRTSLHTYKSDPLHKRVSRGGGRGGHSDRGRGGRGGRGRGPLPSSRGRGQPDMRLRMNVMLEKIKRDLQ